MSRRSRRQSKQTRTYSPSDEAARPQWKTDGEPELVSLQVVDDGDSSRSRSPGRSPGGASPLARLAALSPFSQRRTGRKAARGGGGSSVNGSANDIYIMLAAAVACAALAPPQAWEDVPFVIETPLEELPTSSLLRNHLSTLPDLFGRLDSNANGLIDEGEIGTGAGEVLTKRLQVESEAAAVLAEIETDGKEGLSPEEMAEWLRLCPADNRVASNHFCLQCLCSLLVGLGMGGLAGSSTLGVAVFALASPQGYLCQYNAVVPIVCACCSAAVVGVYLEHASWSKCFQMCKSRTRFSLCEQSWFCLAVDMKG